MFRPSRLFIRSRLLAFPIFLTLLASALRGPQDPCLDQTVAVNVLTEKGASVNRLTEKSFRAEYQRQAVQIVSAKRNLHPPRIVIVLDASGSMSQNHKWYAATTAAKGLFSIAPANTLFAFITFAAQVEDKIDFSKGRVAVAKELSALGSKDWKYFEGRRRSWTPWQEDCVQSRRRSGRSGVCNHGGGDNPATRVSLMYGRNSCEQVSASFVSSSPRPSQCAHAPKTRPAPET